MNFIHENILDIFLIFLGVLIFFAFIWALYLYFKVRDKEFNNKTEYSFHDLANLHKEWAQVWFTISFILFMSALFYGSFYSMKALADANKSTEIMESFFYYISKPNTFIYMLFLVAWAWAIKNYSAHWHNFICNEHRYGAYTTLKQLRDEITHRIQFPATLAPSEPTSTPNSTSTPQWNDSEKRQIQEFQRNLDKRAAETTLMLIEISGLLMMIPSESAYFDKKVDESLTAKIANVGSGIAEAAKHSR